MTAELVVHAQPLRADSFAAFGDVIEIEGHVPRWINQGTCRRFDDLAEIDVSEAGGRPVVSVFDALPRALPLRIATLERHPLSSQAFYPLQPQPFLIVVAEEGSTPLAERVRAYLSSGAQGVNYRRNTWHHALIALRQPARFLVVDRGASTDNCEEVALDDRAVLVDTSFLPNRGTMRQW